MNCNKFFIALSLTYFLFYTLAYAKACDITARFTYTKTVCGKDVSFTDQSATINGTIIKWEWNFGDNSSLSTAKSPVHTYSTTGDVTVVLTVTNNLGCSNSKSQTLHIAVLPFASFTISTPDCANQNITFDPAGSTPGDAAFSTFKWDFGDGIIQTKTDKLPFIHQYLNAGSHTTTLIITSTAGCTSTTAIKTFTVNPTPVIDIIPIYTICQGALPVQFNVDKHGFTGTGVFSGTGISSTGLFNPCLTGPGKFDITYLFTSTAGCTYSAITTIEVDPSPRVTGADIVVLEGGRSKINIAAPIGIEPFKFKWILANGNPATGLDKDNILNPTVTATANISYMLTVTSGEGCNASAIVNVTILKKLVVPNAFTPNGDGINDNWVIPYLNTYSGSSVTIFNRYGFIVYQSTGYPAPWDGTGKEGPVPAGTYYYIIDPKNGNKPLAAA
jgi:gliding motility-associated-like protein